MRSLFLLLQIMVVVLSGSAQPTPVLTTDKTKIYIGEPFQLTLELKAVDRSAAVQWMIPDTLEHFEWISGDTTDVLKRTYTLTSWDSGVWKLQPLQVVVPSNVDGKPMTLTFAAAEIRVEYDTTGSNLLNDIKPIAEVKDAGEQWIGYTLTAAALLALLAFVLLFRKRKRLAEQATGIADVSTAYEQFCAVVKEIRQTDWEHQSTQKQALAKLRTAFQLYMSQTAGPSFSTSTTDQLSVRLQQHLQRSQLLELVQAYRLTDAVLFARFQATPADCEQTLTTVEAIAATIQKGGAQ